MKNWREELKPPMQEMLREIDKRNKGGFRLGPYEILIVESGIQPNRQPHADHHL